MELRHLRYFVAVAEEQNVTRAAARLHVSQPPLSRQIQDLEFELGFGLLERTGKSVRLTEAGKVFLNEARAVLNRADEAVLAARAVAGGHRGEFHLGYAPSPTVEILPGILRAFDKTAPGIRVVLHDLATPQMLAGLRNNQLQAALMVQPSKQAGRGITFEKLIEYPIVVAVPPKHPFARKQTVALSEIVEQPIVVYSRKEFPDYHEMLGRIAGPSAKRLRIVEECDGVLSLIAAIESGKGVTLIASSLANAAGRRLRYTPLSPAPAPAVVGLAYPKAILNAIQRTFIKAAIDPQTNPKGAVRQGSRTK
jgi:DNA-binding transcriptional LysR family regulator